MLLILQFILPQKLQCFMFQSINGTCRQNNSFLILLLLTARRMLLPNQADLTPRELGRLSVSSFRNIHQKFWINNWILLFSLAEVFNQTKKFGWNWNSNFGLWTNHLAPFTNRIFLRNFMHSRMLILGIQESQHKIKEKIRPKPTKVS